MRFTGAFAAGSVFVTEAGVSSADLFSGVPPSAFVSGFVPTVSLHSASCDWRRNRKIRMLL